MVTTRATLIVIGLALVAVSGWMAWALIGGWVMFLLFVLPCGLLGVALTIYAAGAEKVE